LQTIFIFLPQKYNSLRNCASILILSALFGLIIPEGKAQTAPKYSNEFLAIGVGARAFAMGNSVAATTKDITAVYWNPAGLTALENPINIGLMHSEYFSGLAQYDFGALAFKTDEANAFAVSVIRFGVDNIPNTLELIDQDGNIRFDRIQSFSVADYAITFSYAKLLPIKGLAVGGNLKIIRRIGGSFASAWGFGIDLAARYQYKQWHFALMARDITTTYNAWSFNTEELEAVFALTGNTIPENSSEITLPRFVFGAAREFRLSSKFGLLAEANLDITTDGKRNVLLKSNLLSVDPHLGVEAHYQNMIFLRAGINNIQKEFEGGEHTTLQPNIGLGFRYKKLGIDYALTNVGNVSIAGYSHVFSISIALDKNQININKP
jgi:hypothetical protein